MECKITVKAVGRSRDMACIWNSIVMGRLKASGGVGYIDSRDLNEQGEKLNVTIFGMVCDSETPYFYDEEENMTVTLLTIARTTGISIEYYARDPSRTYMEHFIQGRAGAVKDKYYLTVARDSQKSYYTNAIFDGDFNSPEFTKFLEDIDGAFTPKQKEIATMDWIMEHCRGEGFPVGGLDEEYLDDLELYNYR